MDFNDIKHTWKNSFKESVLTNDQIIRRLHIKDRSNTALGKLKKNYKIEIIAGGAEFLLILFGLFFFLEFITAFSFALIVCGLIGFPLFSAWNSYAKVRKTIYTTDNLNDALLKTTKSLQKNIKQGQKSLMRFIMIPFALLTGMAMGLFIAANFNPEKDFIDLVYSLKPETIIKMILIFVAGSCVMIPFSIYSFKKRFNKHYEDLKKNLQDLKDTKNTIKINTKE